MQWKKIFLTAPVVATLALGACGDDDTGPGGDLSESEQQALVEALSQGGALSFNFAAPFALTTGLAQDAQVGSLGSMSAWGSQALVTLDYPGTEDDETLVFTGVTGWSNLNAGNRTVDNALWASVISSTSSFPNQIDEAVMVDEQAFGGYWERSTSSQYFANPAEGQFTLATTSFNSAQDCDIPDLGNGIAITECTFAIGTMTGDFDFVADRISGTGVETYTQANIAYDVPAVRVTIAITVEDSPTPQ
ncbi:MAG TPA: hypothetical protein VFS94_03345 [Gemmatimonadales bacterium]|nr:hypothetical protein [Gemmatimonadales bacterium]